MISKIIFNIGQRLRNPSLNGWSLFLKKSENFTLQELEAYQLKQLQQLVKIAYQHTGFYRKQFDAIEFQPENLESLDDLKKLPIISKKALITNNKEIHTNIKFNKSFKCTTSGTSGETLQFHREEKADSFNRASIFRGYAWYNVQPWEKNGYFWGFNFKGFSKFKTRFLDVLQHRFRLFSFQPNELKRFAKKLQNTKYLHGYSSMIYEVAKYINEHHLQQPSKLKMVKGTSEKIMDTYQSATQKAFGVKMISEYGAAETGIIAFECTHGNMHLNMEGVLVEEIENEIIVTNLQLHAFPVIRYRLGDYIKLAPKEKKCACGMQHPILAEVTGRIGALVYGKSGTYPSLYFYYIFKNLASKEALYLTYQIVQHQKGRLKVYVAQTLNAKELLVLQQEFETYFKKDVAIEIIHTYDLLIIAKKRKSFISTI